MKKFLLSALTILLSFTLTACGTYVGPGNQQGGQQGNQQGNQQGGQQGSGDNGGVNSGVESTVPFTVTLRSNGAPYSSTQGATCVWTDIENKNNKHYATFNGATATVPATEGMNGDFMVTVIDLPPVNLGNGKYEYYTFNPNAYTATSESVDSASVAVDVYKILTPRGSNHTICRTNSGAKEVEVNSLSSAGMYRATLTEAQPTMYFSFKPIVSGYYTLESMVDVSVDKVDPSINLYNGSIASGMYNPKAVENGGASGNFTQNFKHSENLTANWDMLFEISAKNRAGYPINVDFMISYTGEFNQEEIGNYTPYTAKENFKKTPEYAKTEYTWTTSAVDGVFRAKSADLKDLFTLGSDKYYHVNYGYENLPVDDRPILYAKIAQPVTYLNKSNNQVIVPYMDRAIAGYNPAGLPYWVKSDTREVLSSDFKDAKGNVIPEAQRTQVTGGAMTETPLKYIDKHDFTSFVNSYSKNCNTDGVYAVTEELRYFLQQFALSRRLFPDGLNEAYSAEQYGFAATDNSEWLFACGYYTRFA